MKTITPVFNTEEKRQKVFTFMTPERRRFLLSLLPPDRNYMLIYSHSKCDCGRNLFYVTDSTLTTLEGELCAVCSLEGLPGL
jgi:hypothetical protein